MAKPVVYGPSFSTYVRAVRLALSEKDVAYGMEELNIFTGVHKEPEHLTKHPFAKVPVLAHEGFTIYETCAILRYIDEAFQGPRLQPGDPRGRARMTQTISVIDSYTYAPVVAGIVIPRFMAMKSGTKADEAAIEASIQPARQAVAALETLFVGEFMAGKTLSLADLHFAPIYDYFRQTPEGESLLSEAPRLSRWWSTMSRRPSLQATAPSLT
jgi:glutathione S-transferase